MIADGACCKSAGGQKDFKAPGTGRVLEQVAARMKRVMGLTAKVSGGEAVRLTAELDPKAKKGRPALKTDAAQEKALRHGGGAALQK